MNPTISTELLVRLAQATAEQQAEIARLLGCEATVPAEPVSEDVARQVFALIRELEIEGRWRKAPILQVFRLYCMEGLTAKQVARRCGCAKSLVILRLKALRKKTGREPAQLRNFSAHFEKIEDSLRDSRSSRIDRRSALDEPHSGEDEL